MADVALVAVLALTGLGLGVPMTSLITRYAPPLPGNAPASPGPPSPTSSPGTSASPGPSASPDPRPHLIHADRRGALLVGSVTGVLLGLIGARVHPALVLVAACGLAVSTVPLAFIDVAVKRLPDVFTGAAYAATAVFLFLAATVGGHWGALGRAAMGGLTLAAVYLALLLISPSGMGLGDVKLAASLGTMLAWTSWDLLLLGGFAGFALAAVYSVVLLATGRATRKQAIPFGPFMIAGAFLALLLS